MPLSICVAVSANCPEYGMISPIRTGPWARAGDAAIANVATAPSAMASARMVPSTNLGASVARPAKIVLALPGRRQERPSHPAPTGYHRPGRPDALRHLSPLRGLDAGAARARRRAFAPAPHRKHRQELRGARHL